MVEYGAAINVSFLGSSGLPFCALVALHLQMGGVPLDDAVWVNYKNGENTEVKAHVPGK